MIRIPPTPQIPINIPTKKAEADNTAQEQSGRIDHVRLRKSRMNPAYETSAQPMKCYTENEEPQPQVVDALGLFIKNLAPIKSSR